MRNVEMNPKQLNALGPISPELCLLDPELARAARTSPLSRLQDAGFAWKLSGAVQGYAGNRVTRQSPTPGTVVVDTGAPTISISLAHDEAYVPRRRPDNRAPYPGTTLEIAPLSDAPLADVLERMAGAPVLNRCERGQSPAISTPHGF
jgi:hypothetical protein